MDSILHSDDTMQNVVRSYLSSIYCCKCNTRILNRLNVGASHVLLRRTKQSFWYLTTLQVPDTFERQQKHPPTPYDSPKMMFETSKMGPKIGPSRKDEVSIRKDRTTLDPFDCLNSTHNTSHTHTGTRGNGKSMALDKQQGIWSLETRCVRCVRVRTGRHTEWPRVDSRIRRPDNTHSVSAPRSGS